MLTWKQARAQISGVQDWRVNATVVFTVITVIFLPLSFFASVFGMNTSDLRDMTLTQRAFWVSACSFTIAVILVTVYFVDAPPLWRWLEQKGSRDRPGEMSMGTAPFRKDFSFATLARQRRGHGIAVAASTPEDNADYRTSTDQSLASSEEES